MIIFSISCQQAFCTQGSILTGGRKFVKTFHLSCETLHHQCHRPPSSQYGYHFHNFHSILLLLDFSQLSKPSPLPCFCGLLAGRCCKSALQRPNSEFAVAYVITVHNSASYVITPGRGWSRVMHCEAQTVNLSTYFTGVGLSPSQCNTISIKVFKVLCLGRHL